MCGINGIISKQVISCGTKRIQAMNQALAHRGPDADRHYSSDNGTVFLGHRRLAILDLDSRSNQPMRLNNGNWIVVFNGEIFNFKDIRFELSNLYSFQTASDTEVLLAALEFKGIDWFLKKANGMFAFAAYNAESKETYLVRDRFGIKPLFYTTQNGILIFSSEIKGILNCGLLEPEFNTDAIDDYLGNRYMREPFTFFKNIYQLKSSHYIHFDIELSYKEICYWQLPSLNFSSQYDESSIIEKTNEQIRAAFQRWFVSDVKIGAYLSGGLDSSLTTAILSEYSDKQINTYTIGFELKDFNEFIYAQKVADSYKTNHHALLCKIDNYFDDWTQLIHYKDAPLAVPNEIPLAQMSSVLSNDITVVISGEGADELFGGYGRIFRAAFDFNNHFANKNTFYDYFIEKYEYVPRTIRDKYLTGNSKYRSHFDEIIKIEFKKNKNEENIFRFFHNYHIQGLLQRLDMTTMQTSVEARSPFLDHELIEFVYTQIPYNLKLHWQDDTAKCNAKKMFSTEYSEKLDTPKYILKKVAQRYLPDDIIYRKKMGFPVPLSTWFKNLTELSEILKKASWLKNDKLENLLEEIKKDSKSGQLLWMFINIQLFYNQYFTKKWIW
ncbi:asparagine synthase (glutamine-hydrolyzing) [Bacteroidales bacterium OttesenSCG-928-I21]|nr:asparagine synthase (glutamine-hydrolyzing) [Bacteroidales bacterium OttesenSCG-928-I21]